jgi:hypothetical protein
MSPLVYLHILYSLEQTLIFPKKLLLDVNDLVALRLPAGIFMGTFVVMSYGGELLHFPVVPFSGFIIVFVFVISLYIL